MEIRLAGYETQVWSEHFCKFVKAYAQSVSKAHPAIKQWAENIESCLTTSVPLSTPIERSTTSPAQSTMSVTRNPVSKHSMLTTPKASLGASLSSKATSSNAKLVTPTPPVSAAPASSSATTTSANNKGASGPITTATVAPERLSSACAHDGGRSSTVFSATPLSTPASQAHKSASNDASATSGSVAIGYQTPGLAESRYASIPAVTASYPHPNTRKALESASLALTNTKGSVGDFKVSNAGSKTTPLFSLPSSIPKSKGASIQFGQAGVSWRDFYGVSRFKHSEASSTG